MYQLEKHSEFLDGFLKLFKVVDTNMDGVMNEEEFVQLIVKMQIGLNPQQTQAFLEHLDPFNHQRITFSDVIRVLSTKTFSNDDDSK